MPNVPPSVVYWLEVLRIVGTALLIGGGILITVLALFADRSRAGRCPKCWYSMSGTSGLACPECGHACSSERQLFRIRRHRGRALCGIAIAILGLLSSIDWSSLRSDPWANVPSWILVRIARPFPLSSMFHGADDKLRQRINALDLSDAQWQIVLSRVIHHAEQISSPLLISRNTWPGDVPIFVSWSPHVSNLLPRGLLEDTWLQCRLLTTSDGKPGDWVRTARGVHDEPFAIGMAKEGVRAIDVEVELRGEGSRTFWHGVCSLPVNVSGTSQKRLTPVTSPDGPAFAAWLSPLVCVGNGHGTLFVNLGNREAIFGRYVALGFKFRVLRDGVPVLTTSFAAHPLPEFVVAIGPWPSDPDTVLVEPAWAERRDQSQVAASVWEVECVGDRSLALLDYDWECQRNISPNAGDGSRWTEPTEYWDGSFRVRVTPTLCANSESAKGAADRAMAVVREKFRITSPAK